jgi:hypothetical protein
MLGRCIFNRGLAVGHRGLQQALERRGGVMDRERFEAIMKGDSDFNKFNQCTALLGLNLIAKYLPESGIGAASHDVIYACCADELLEAGLTEEDAHKLREMNWMIDEDSLAKFV